MSLALKKALDIVREVSYRRSRRKIYDYFPDEGSLRRELYHKHLAFFRAGIGRRGRPRRERAAIAANRCITPWTYIETEGTKRLFGELLTEKGARVRAWGNGSECDAQLRGGFLKGIEPVFRVVLDTGEFFDCSREHQVLTHGGYISFDRLVSLSSGLRLWQRREDYQANCVLDGYLGDRPLQFLGGIDLTSPLTQAGVQGRAPLFYELEDVEARIHQCNLLSLGSDHLSTQDDLVRFAGLFSLFSGPSSASPCLQLSDGIRAFRQLVLASNGLPQSCAVSPFSGQSSEHNLREPLFSSLSERDSFAGKETTPLFPARLHSYQHFGCGVEELIPNSGHIATFYPLFHPPLVGGQRIFSIVPLGLQPILDAQVPGVNNYKAGGVFHHNCGKTETMGGYEVVMHLTGDYPDWWDGYRFEKPVSAWACGDTTKTVRDIIQAKLVGEPGIPDKEGTGLIPGDNLISWTRKAGGVPNCIDTVYVRHKSGGLSQVSFKSYEEGRKSFQGTSKDIIWCDEEPPMDVYTEILLRTMDCDGMVLLTFTPLSGLSDVVLSFLPGGKLPEDGEENGGKVVISATWDDAPHLDPEVREELWAAMLPSQRAARSKGVPSLGSGAIYPLEEEDITVEDFAIPVHWPRCYMLDVGWNRTAVLWGAYDRENDIMYVTGEYYRGEAEPAIHAAAIRSRGDWIPGAIDPAARGRSQKDGQKLIDLYRDAHLKLVEATNAVEAGLYETWGRLSTGRLKVFKSCRHFFEEFRIYRRDEKGKIVKERDHLMDCMRYLCLNFERVQMQKPAVKDAVVDRLKQLGKAAQRSSMSA